MITASQITGFTLPGMMLDPGWTAGSVISARPQRGPLFMRRTSPAILIRLAATPPSAPLVAERRKQLALDLEHRRDVERGGDHVVAALPEVDVVVGVDPSSQQLRGAARDHLVGVHVGAGAAPGLEHVDRELGVPATVPDLRRGLLDGLRHRP